MKERFLTYSEKGIRVRLSLQQLFWLGGILDDYKGKAFCEKKEILMQEIADLWVRYNVGRYQFSVDLEPYVQKAEQRSKAQSKSGKSSGKS